MVSYGMAFRTLISTAALASHLDDPAYAIVDGIIFVATRQIWFLVVMHAAFDIAACLIIYFGLETRLANLFFN